MAQQDAQAFNDETITVTMNGHEVAAVTAAIMAYIMLVTEDPVMYAVFGEDIAVLQRWVESIKPLVSNMAAMQRAAAKEVADR